MEEEAGMVAVPLRARTSGNLAPETDFQVVVRAVKDTDANSQAEVGQDYAPFSPTYIFRAADFTLQDGVYAHTVSRELEIIDDEITERVESFLLQVDTSTLPEHVTAPDDIILEMRNTDVTTVSVVTTESEVAEGDDVAVTLMLDNPVPFRITVLVVIASGTAEKGEDFDGASKSYRFASGVTEVTLSVSTLQDKLTEGDETFTYQSQANGLPDDTQLGGATVGSVTIIDDDHAPEVETPSALKAADYTTSIATLRATDQDGDDLTWEITGDDDQGLFSLTGEGALSFTSRQSHDSPRDANQDRFYRVNVEVPDGFNPTEARLTVELLPGLIVENVTRTAADVAVNVPLCHVGDTVQLQYGASYGEWTTLRRTAAGGGEVFALSGLGAGTSYAVRATLRANPLRRGDWFRGGFETKVSLRYGPDTISATPTGDGGYKLT